MTSEETARSSSGNTRGLGLEDLGIMGYEAALALMRGRVEQRASGLGEDVLLIVEHPEVITLGRRKSARDNVLTDGVGVPIVEVERGGDVTWHGPGQIVGYPIVRLDEGERDVHLVLRKLEDALIATLTECGLAATRKAGHTGVWSPHANDVDTANIGSDPSSPRLFKVVSLGIAVTHWVTSHGFALNVDNDLARFRAINPCGLDAAVMGSMRSLGAIVPARDALIARIHQHLANAFSRRK